MSEIRAISPGGKERVVAGLPGLLTLADVSPAGGVLVNRQDFRWGIRGSAASLDNERELGWFDTPFAADISRDGRTLLFWESGLYGGNLYAVCLRGMDGSPPVRLGEGYACALSPDGKQVLAVLYETPHRLMLLPTGAGDSTSLPRGSIERYDNAGWLPDGKSVVFTGSEAGHALRTYVQDVEGGLPRAISAEGIAGWRVSPDGRLVAALSRDEELYVCPTRGDSARRVARLLPDELILQWTADGRALYVGRPGVSVAVSRVEVSAGRRSPWRTFGLSDSTGVKIYDPVLTPDGRSYAYTYVRQLCDLYLVEGLR